MKPAQHPENQQLTRIQPRLTVLAALGLAVLQVCAIAFHLSRGEKQQTRRSTL